MDRQRKADMMLVLATGFWGISNCLIAICLRDMQPVTLNAFRFLSAFAVLGAVFHKRVLRASRETWRYSVLVGLSLVVIYLGATYGVLYTSVSNAGFIGAMTVLFTPFFEFVVYRKRPDRKLGFALAVCMAGMALLTLNEALRPAPGDIICLLVPTFYAVDLMVTEKAVAKPEVDPIALGVLQTAVAGVVMNRVHATGGEYARVGQGSIRKIIMQPGQFVCASETEGGAYNPQNIYNMRPEQIHYDIADWAIAGNRIPDVAESLWFYNPFGPRCRSRFPSDVGYWQTRIGDHCFYNPTGAYFST